QCKVDGHSMPANTVMTRHGVLSLILDGRSYQIMQETSASETTIIIGQERFSAALRDPRSLRSHRGAGSGSKGPQKIIAPMPGKVIRILASAGDEVQAGQGLVIIEAMKMQNELKSPRQGKVKKILIEEGALTEPGQIVAEIE
ncbi:MAG TPA: biotin/lipoyl-containing protein, partial [Candidatus Angelobacter sp.]|nr:biotin/lipoyl-containing protein [Candidatus Angelobacter sp.]